MLEGLSQLVVTQLPVQASVQPLVRDELAAEQRPGDESSNRL